MQEANMDADNTDKQDLKAPVELKMKFLQALKDKNLQLSKTLCQMILTYEPDSPEASEFLSLIQSKLLKEQKAEQPSSEEDDEDNDEDDNRDNGSESDEGSSDSSSCSSSSSSSSTSDSDVKEGKAIQ
ncbi:glutamate-rich protein 2 [Gouania willdenowi]|uniref:glutamate-rich protein 2 n=1 Tax=Gouania willdenowi TaxID=441366 RepID=UPI0010546C62|nr:glutamate-rich protein 2-like [Gouania willdenowi]